MRTKGSGESTLLLLDPESPNLDLLRNLAARYGSATAQSLESLLSGLN